MSDTPTPNYGEPWKEVLTWDELITAGNDQIFYPASSMWEPYRSRIIACVNACAGMVDPAKEITAMREAIKEAIEHLCNVGSGRGCLLGFNLDAAQMENDRLMVLIARLHLAITARMSADDPTDAQRLELMHAWQEAGAVLDKPAALFVTPNAPACGQCADKTPITPTTETA